MLELPCVSVPQAIIENRLAGGNFCGCKLRLVRSTGRGERRVTGVRLASPLIVSPDSLFLICVFPSVCEDSSHG